MLIIGCIDEEVRVKYEEFKKYVLIIGGLVFVSGWMGIDLLKVLLDYEIIEVDLLEVNKVWSIFDFFIKMSEYVFKWIF